MIRHIDIKRRNDNPTISESDGNSCQSEEVDISFRDAEEGSVFEIICLRPDVKMIIANYEQSRPLRMEYEIGDAPVSFSYNLSQHTRCLMTHGIRNKQVIERYPGDGAMAYIPQTRGTIDISPAKRVMGVSLHFCVHTFRQLFNKLPQCLDRLGWDNPFPAGKRFYQQSRFNRETFLVLRQILGCPYQGEIRRLFFEAKSLELVAHKLAELGENSHKSTSDLSSRDSDRVREAYHILLSTIEHPPSLMDLSRLVGINRNKLNRGFREIYGDTVFDVLRNARLSKASDLLQQTEMSLAEIALSVGYNNQSNFTTAFRRQFGKTPKAARRV